MNFLQLCQRVFIEGGVSGQITSTQNQRGEALRVVGWVQAAYTEILNDQAGAWDFVRRSATVQLTQGKGDYTFSELGLTDAVQWDTRSMRVSTLQSLEDQSFISHMAYSDFRDYWLFGTQRTIQQLPVSATVGNQGELLIAPLPAGDYWLELEYLASPTLQQDADTPVLPPRFHMAVMWRALRHYGLFEAAPETVARADIALKEMMLHLAIDSSPEVEVGEPLC